MLLSSVQHKVPQKNIILIFKSFSNSLYKFFLSPVNTKRNTRTQIAKDNPANITPDTLCDAPISLCMAFCMRVGIEVPQAHIAPYRALFSPV